MEELIQRIFDTVDKKKVQSLCKKILKKCSFKSSRDLDNVIDLAVWLYIYEYYDYSVSVCDILTGLEFTGNYNLWDSTDIALCLKARIMREQGITANREQLLEKVNEHRHPELYGNLIDWYRGTVNKNIGFDDQYHPNKIYPGWRLVKLKVAVKYKEAGGHPISDEEFESDIKEIVNLLKPVK